MQWELSSEFTKDISQMGFSQDNKKIIWISETSVVHSWEIVSKDVQSIPVEDPGFGAIVALSTTSMQVALIVSGHGILIWDTATGKIRTRMFFSHLDYDKRPSSDRYERLFFSLDGKRVVYDVSDRELHFWDTTTGRLQKKLAKPPGFSHCSGHSPDGSRIAYHFPWDRTCSYNIVLWDTISDRTWLIKAVEAGYHIVECLKFSSDGKKIACGFFDGSLVVWDISTDKAP